MLSEKHHEGSWHSHTAFMLAIRIRRNEMTILKVALQNLTKENLVKNDDVIVVLAGNFSGGSGFSFIEVGTVEYLRDRVDIID